MNEKPVRTERFGDYMLSVWVDESSMNPRELGDPLFTMVSWDGMRGFQNSCAADIVESRDQQFTSMEEWEESIEDVRTVNFPFNYTDYSSGGIRIGIGESNRLDNEYDGAFYVTVEDALKEKFDPLTADGRESLRKLLCGEVKELQDWCNGEVYGYVIRRVCPHCDQEVKNAEPVESCWGYYGEEDVAWDEGMSVIAHLLQEQRRGKNDGDTEAIGDRCDSTGADVRGGK